MKHLSLLMALILFLASGCLSLKGKDKTTSSDFNQLQLQEDLQRFYSRFTERIVDAFKPEDLVYQQHKLQLLRQYTLYDSEALNISTSPFPVLSLFDMLVFVKLNKIVIKKYWVPKVYGEGGEKLLSGFEESERDINSVALKYIPKERLKDVNRIVTEWRRANPEKVRVEKIRLASFSDLATTEGGQKDKSSFSLSHLVVDTQGAVSAVDDVVLVSNRAMFLAQHIPIILRTQARIGAQEIIEDSVDLIQSAPKVIDEAQPLVHDMTSMIREADRLTLHTQSVLKMFPEFLIKGDGKRVNEMLTRLESVLDKTAKILQNLNRYGPIDEKLIKEFEEHLYKLIGFCAIVFVLVAAAILLSWWGCYYMYKKFGPKRNV
jgi:hypothetical protein